MRKTRVYPNENLKCEYKLCGQYQSTTRLAESGVLRAERWERRTESGALRAAHWERSAESGDIYSMYTTIVQWNMDNPNSTGPPKKFELWKVFELWVILSLCFSHVATVASSFRCNVFHFLAKLSKICEIFFSWEKKTMKLSLSHKNINTSIHRKGNLMALTAV